MAGTSITSDSAGPMALQAFVITRYVAGSGMSAAGITFFAAVCGSLIEDRVNAASGFQLRLGVSVFVALLCVLTALDLKRASSAASARFSKHQRGLLSLGPALVGAFAGGCVARGECPWFYGLNIAVGATVFAASLGWALLQDRKAIQSGSTD